MNVKTTKYYQLEEVCRNQLLTPGNQTSTELFWRLDIFELMMAPRMHRRRRRSMNCCCCCCVALSVAAILVFLFLLMLKYRACSVHVLGVCHQRNFDFLVPFSLRNHI
ncbi:hypothetical protein ABFX02_09G046500 [Erythranthe guttata]